MKCWVIITVEWIQGNQFLLAGHLNGSNFTEENQPGFEEKRQKNNMLLSNVKVIRMSRIPDRQFTSEEDYRNIFEAASDGLVIYDIEADTVVEANPSACEMHGYTHQEFIGLGPTVFMLPESHVLFKEHVQAAKPGLVFEALVIHKRKDETPFHVEVRSQRSITGDGRAC